MQYSPNSYTIGYLYVQMETCSCLHSFDYLKHVEHFRVYHVLKQNYLELLFSLLAFFIDTEEIAAWTLYSSRLCS